MELIGVEVDHLLFSFYGFNSGLMEEGLVLGFVHLPAVLDVFEVKGVATGRVQVWAEFRGVWHDPVNPGPRRTGVKRCGVA